MTDDSTEANDPRRPRRLRSMLMATHSRGAMMDAIRVDRTFPRAGAKPMADRSALFGAPAGGELVITAALDGVS